MKSHHLILTKARAYLLLISLIGDSPLKLHLGWKDLKAVELYLMLVIVCMSLSLIVTSATGFYSYESPFLSGIHVYRGWPLAWSVEQIGGGGFINPNYPPSAPLFDFQALNFLIDLVLWMTIFLLPSSLYLYRTRLRMR